METFTTNNLINTEIKHYCTVRLDQQAIDSSEESIPNELSSSDQCDSSAVIQMDSEIRYRNDSYKTPEPKHDAKTERSIASNYAPDTLASTSEKHEPKEL